jgi:hypothetical protein
MLKVFSKDSKESVAEESPKEEPESASAQSDQPEKGD